MFVSSANSLGWVYFNEFKWVLMSLLLCQGFLLIHICKIFSNLCCWYWAITLKRVKHREIPIIKRWILIVYSNLGCLSMFSGISKLAKISVYKGHQESNRGIRKAILNNLRSLLNLSRRGLVLGSIKYDRLSTFHNSVMLLWLQSIPNKSDVLGVSFIEANIMRRRSLLLCIY